jgi:hypothetical protein
VLIVGEPHNELALFVLPNADFFFRNCFDAELLLSRQVLSFEKPRLMYAEAKSTIGISYCVLLRLKLGCQPGNLTGLPFRVARAGPG